MSKLTRQKKNSNQSTSTVNSSGMICRYRTQDLQDGFGDDYCKDCWEYSLAHLQNGGPAHSHTRRADCYSENAVHGSNF